LKERVGGRETRVGVSACRRVGEREKRVGGSAGRRVGEREKRIGETAGRRAGETGRRIALRSLIVIVLELVLVLGFSGWSFFRFGESLSFVHGCLAAVALEHQ